MKIPTRFQMCTLVLLLAGLACSLPAFQQRTSVAATLAVTPLPTSAPQATPESETNPAPNTQPAPLVTPQSAAPGHNRSGDPIMLDAIDMFDASHGWAISGAYVLVTVDGGLTWREATPPESLPAGSQVNAQGVFLDPKEAWIVFSVDDYVPPQAAVWHTSDGGYTWTASAPLDHQAIGDHIWAEFSVLDSLNLWLIVRGVYAGAGTHYAAQFFRTSDGGLSWLALPGDVGVDYSGLTFTDESNGILTWQTTGAYAPAPPAYAVTSDGGVNWETRELPEPPDAPGLFDASPYCESFQPRAFSARSLRLLVGCFDYFNPPHVFSSYIYASEDGGVTWLSYKLPNKAHAAQDALRFFDVNNGFLLGREIYRTTDGGQNWSFVKSVNWDGQFSFVDSQTGWAVARAEDQLALVKTTNGGDTWSEIRPVITK